MSNQLYKVHLSGPMTGRVNFNYDQFEAVGVELQRKGCFIVFNPASLDEKKPYNELMKQNLLWVFECDFQFCLDGWNYSPGATAEGALAVAIKVPRFMMKRWESPAIAVERFYQSITKRKL